MTRQNVALKHPAWHDFRPGDRCITPSGRRAVVIGMGSEMRIEVRYLEKPNFGQVVELKAELLRRHP